ncbi:hypothetical protein FHW69_002235 [Luteibacter sp. Sphag1AF]|uniref:DUF6630 family protein n=1 Tax=Luteibacter sp. Sphag1AF TaxID=2587031 RepID=UPI001613F0BF|nr:hypothetical protein [Luteibacter sp. Sphag1AF]MBB3227612.1 hypothetical protein [Luteibacter sp. Sphag1AF]
MNSYDDDYDIDPELVGDEENGDTTEACVWQLLLLINPGDEDMAEQQFHQWRDFMATADADEAQPMEAVTRVIDWRSGFRIEADDTVALVEAINELAMRWDIHIDWNGDASDDEFHENTDAPELFAVAYDYLAQHGYTLWAYETDDGMYAGFISQTRDAEPMRELATALGINMRLGSDVS